MEQIDRLCRELPPTRIRRLSPQLGSILLILALLILLVVLLMSRHHDLEVFSVLLGIVLAALCVVVFLLTRFLRAAWTPFMIGMPRSNIARSGANILESALV
jgi:hypothetical protein